MTATRASSLALVGLLAAIGCGKSRGPETPATSMVTLPGGAADGSDVTVDGRWCVTCHGDATRTPLTTDAAGVAFAPPVDASGAATGAKVGAHQTHLRAGSLRGSGVDCATCHVTPANGEPHTPGVALRGLASVALASGPAISPAYSAGTCSNTYCHGKFNGGLAATVSWTGTSTEAACGSCHAIPPLLKTNGTAHTTSTTCGNCHGGYTNVSVNPATHVNGQIDLSGGGCTGCHGDATRANGGQVGASYDPNQSAAPPLDTNLASTGVLVGVHLAHVNPDNSGVYKPLACTECHPDNTVVSHPSGGRVDIIFAPASSARLAGYLPSNTPGDGTATAITCAVYCHDGAALGAGYGGSSTNPGWNDGPATCASCHAFPPPSPAHAGVAASATACNACHSGTVNVDGTINIAGGLHINGQLDGGESTGGVSCGTCHSTIFNAMNGTVAKSFKHTLGNTPGTNDSPTNPLGLTWGNPLTSNLPAQRSCVGMCHGDHPHDLPGTSTTHEYNAYVDSATAASRGTTPTVATRNKTDFDGTLANGGLCASCHQNPISAGRPTISKTAFAASPHDYVTADGFTWEFRLHTTTDSTNAFQRNCTKCHSSPTEGTTPSIAVNSSGANSVHFSDNRAILAGKYNPAGTGTGGFICFNCHGSAAAVNGAQGDRSGKILQVTFAKSSIHPVTSDAVHDTNAEAAAGYDDGKFSGANRHVNCLDCHAPHSAGNTLHAQGSNAIAATSPLNGQSGVAFTPPATDYATTSSANLTFKATATLEYEVCFKCHSSFAFGATPATGQEGLAETDVAQDFNPNNHSVHPIAGPNTYWPLNQPAVRLGNQWTAGVGQTMYCADCHGSEAITGAQGPHGSAALFILKGAPGGGQTYWPTNASGAYFELGGTVTGLFCLNCHPNLNSTTSPNSNTLHRQSAHRGVGATCIDCHVRVPHGSKIPRLLITNTGGLPARLKDPNAWATTGRTPNWSSGFNPPTAWARSNTRTSDMGTSQCTTCGQHSCSSATYTCEAW